MMQITIRKRFAKLSYALFLMVSTGLAFFSLRIPGDGGNVTSEAM